MNTNSQNPFSGSAAHAANSNGEETLRLIANLPAPEGLEDRVHEVLRSAARRGRILPWPARLSPGSSWMRAAAAAAIAFVVAGGGWGVYSRVEQGRPPQLTAMPHVAAPGSFSGAGAMRTPQTLNGPVLTQPAKVQPLPGKAAKKAAARNAPGAPASGQSGPTANRAPQLAAPASK